MLLESQLKVGKHILDIWAVFLESPENVGRHLPLFWLIKKMYTGGHISFEILKEINKY